MKITLDQGLVLSCSGCNRAKGAGFEVGEDRLPLLIDPTRDEPWAHLFYDSRTGNVTFRYTPATQRPDPRGQYTIERSRLPLNIQAVIDRRLSTQANLFRCVHRFLEARRDPRGRDTHQAELFKCIDDNSGYGLASWFFVFEGNQESPLVELRQSAPDVCALAAAHVAEPRMAEAEPHA